MCIERNSFVTSRPAECGFYSSTGSLRIFYYVHGWISTDLPLPDCLPLQVNAQVGILSICSWFVLWYICTWDLLRDGMERINYLLTPSMDFQTKLNVPYNIVSIIIFKSISPQQTNDANLAIVVCLIEVLGKSMHKVQYAIHWAMCYTRAKRIEPNWKR